NNTVVSSGNNSSDNATLKNQKTTTTDTTRDESVKTGINTKKSTKVSYNNITAKTTKQSAVATGKQNKASKNDKNYNRNSQSATAHTEKRTSAKTKRISKNNTAATNRIAASVNVSKKDNHTDTTNGNTSVKNNSVTKDPDSKTDSSVPAATSSNNVTANNEKVSSAIETKSIGGVNIENITDTTKVAADSLKVTVATEETKKDDENKKDSIPPVPYKKFSVYAYGGPSYFSFPNRTVVTDSTTSDINTKSTTRFGVLLGYNLNRKLSIRTGVSVYKLKQSANGIKLNYTMESTGTDIGIMPPDNFTWIDYTGGVTNGSVIDKLATVSVNNYAAIINIDRELSYFEIPFEVNYNLFDRRFGINVFGGGSMLLLNKNEVTAYNEKGKMYLGEWNAAKKTSFTGALGLGLYYKISPSIQVNTEPVFNYYFNSYSDSKPYSFTFRIGLQYNFDF
ncbi:MAG: hypothetical protein DI539_19550, partial [Flavobacterium psychrophilum]